MRATSFRRCTTNAVASAGRPSGALRRRTPLGLDPPQPARECRQNRRTSMNPNRLVTAAAASVVALVAAAVPAAAQTYPTRPITMVVAYAAGGPVDTLARIF